MIHGDREKLRFVKVESFHSKAASHQFQMAIQDNGACTGNLVCCDVVGSIFRLRLEFDIQKWKSKLLIRYSVAPSKLVVNKKIDGRKLVFSEGCFGVSKCQVGFRFWQREWVDKQAWFEGNRDGIEPQSTRTSCNLWSEISLIAGMICGASFWTIPALFASCA